MKGLAMTTEMEPAIGRAVQRRASSTPTSTPFTSRTASPDTHSEESIPNFNPPTYTYNSDMTPISVKENHHRANLLPKAAPQFMSMVALAFLHMYQVVMCYSIVQPSGWLKNEIQRFHHCLRTALTIPAVDSGPSDPVSGILTATHCTVIGVLGGVADYPVAISRIATSDPLNSKREAASFALDSGKGVSRIVGTALKAPMEYTTGISEGFNNVPKMWGDDTVRETEPVTGVKSGLKAAGKGFGLGLYDGISGLITQPVKGAQEGGIAGFVGGFLKGIGGAACKPVAGAVGLPANALKGFYEEYQKKRGTNAKSNTFAAQMQEGWEQFGYCSVEERSGITAKWAQFETMRGQGGFKMQTM